MDASASPRVNAKFDNLFGFYVKIENSPFSLGGLEKKTVIKYTRLPDFDLDRVSWPRDSYALDPRFRRIVTVEEPIETTSRSLKSEVALPARNMNANIVSRRKIVTIKEDDENDLHPKFSRSRGKYAKPVNRSVSSQFMEEKQVSQRSTTRLSNSPKTSKDIKLSAKNSLANSKKVVSSSKLSCRSKNLKVDNQASNTFTNKSYRGEGKLQNSQSANASTKITLSKKIFTPCQSEREIHRNKSKLNNDWKNVQTKINTDSKPYKSKMPSCKDIKGHSVTVIHVPLDSQSQERDPPKIQYTGINSKTNKPITVSRSSEVDRSIFLKDMNVGTDPVLYIDTADRFTEIDNDQISCNTLENNVRNHETKQIFDSLDIPNVSLTKNKNDLPKEEIVNFFSKSLPNIRNPPINFSIEEKNNEQIEESLFCKSTSYIISRATLTYTSKQKIDFHVVESSKNSLEPHNRGTPNSINYPMNVVSVYKKELEQREYCDSAGLKQKEGQNSKTCRRRKSRMKHRNDVMSVNCSVVLDDNKLTKPSDIISTIKLNNGPLQNSLMCQQFQRELNFIDSFFESLQYLETCSLSEKCFTENKVDNWIGNSYNFNNYEYGTLLSKLENGIDMDNKETMVSESLCLLNLLIRDEQRRAKKLLFVLKLREDALKDFTKSQILWLEKKKKQDNTDIPTLKKKQRGALLKLQHECGEMQRMRKALLTLSERRKTAFIKTKKNIEWKLENNVDVDQIMLGKRKMKRSLSVDRNISPLKCFDLSSSGCDESISSRSKLDAQVFLGNEVTTVTSAEKYVQTGDSLSAAIPMDECTSTAAENFVVVDGGYLNILFQNILLPQIFSSEKQYEVNEEALKNIITTSNQRHANVDDSDILVKLINQIKDHDIDRTSAPSTARSLVEEFDQYYKGLNDDDTSPTSHSESDVLDEIKDLPIRLMPLGEVEKTECSTQVSTTDIDETLLKSNNNVISIDQECVCEPSMISVETQSLSSTDADTCVSGPLPIPAGAAAVVEALLPSTWLPEKSSSTSSIGSDSSISSNPIDASVSSLTVPVQNEAEELRRQQLAIEREIKALEQQQSQLLVVREIPDKPPPPYTPPVELRPRTPQAFAVAETTTDKIRKYISDPTSAIDSDPFDVFVKDFCQETLQRQSSEQSERFWDTCNAVPPKPPPDAEKQVNKTALELQDVLTSVAPTVVSGVGARRSDHIDDILFAEWRRCEPEWTSLHADEVIVKNQLFESIFQKVLTETIDEYKKNVLTEN